MKEFTLSGPGWFDRQPDPVIWARDGAVAYYNPAAAALAGQWGWALAEGAALPPPLAELAAGETGGFALNGTAWTCRTWELEGGTLFQLSPAPGFSRICL